MFYWVGILRSRSCDRRQMVLRHSGAMHPKRIPLSGFPDVVLHAEESSTKRHPQFAAAKAGDIVAAGTVVAEFIDSESVERLRVLLNDQPAELLPVHALEIGGVNEIPVALARELGRRLGMPVNTSVVQSNAVGHTGADGFHRLANQALFEGTVTPGARYVVVDDFVGQGGTLANLIGFVFRGSSGCRRHSLDRKSILRKASSGRAAD